MEGVRSDRGSRNSVRELEKFSPGNPGFDNRIQHRCPPPDQRKSADDYGLFRRRRPPPRQIIVFRYHDPVQATAGGRRGYGKPALRSAQRRADAPGSGSGRARLRAATRRCTATCRPSTMMTCAGDDRRRNGPIFGTYARSRGGRPVRRRGQAARQRRRQNAASDDDPASCWNSPASAAPCGMRRRKRRLHATALAIGEDS